MQKCGEKQDWRLIYVLIWQTGDVALPGGKVEKVDADDSATALREANEEIGLEPNLVQVVATLETFISQVLWLSLFAIWYFFFVLHFHVQCKLITITIWLQHLLKVFSLW